MWFNIGLCLSGWCRKCIFVWTILSQTPRRTPQVTSDAGRISVRIFWLFPKERECWENEIIKVGCLFTFWIRWMTVLATHRQKKVQAMSWKNLQMLEICLFTWSWMGPINCAPNPIREKVKKTKIFVKQSFFNEFRWNFAHRSGIRIEIIWNYFWKKFKFKF